MKDEVKRCGVRERGSGRSLTRCGDSRSGPRSQIGLTRPLVAPCQSLRLGEDLRFILTFVPFRNRRGGGWQSSRIARISARTCLESRRKVVGC